MANHCENVLRICGNHADIIRFDCKFRGGKEKKYHFENLYPTPSLSICETAEWRKAHWSVTGNFYEETFDRDTIRDNDVETYYYFDTPCVPPEALIQHVSEEFTALDFMLVYSEYGNGIGGIGVYRGGERIFEDDLTLGERKCWFGDEKTLGGA